MDLERAVLELAERVARLEAGRHRPLDSVLDPDVETPPDGEVVYSGLGPWDDHAVAWQMRRTWDDVLATDTEHAARVLAALASPARLRIVGALVAGPASTGELADRLADGTTGQLFHHLKGLLAAGLVHQPRRGLYALRPQHAVPLLVVLSASFDLTASTVETPP